jgi:hypothetical protein
MCGDDLTATVMATEYTSSFERVKDREFVVGSFPKNLAENRESLGNSRNVSIILDMSRSFSVSSRSLVCITEYLFQI